MTNLRTSILLLIFLISSLVADDQKTFQVQELKALPQHQRVVQKVTQILTKLHYKDVNISDSLSSQLFTNYLDFLDYNKSYFLASDIEGFEMFRYNFDQYIITGNLEPVYFMFNTFQKRMSKRLDYIYERIDMPFDFTINEYYEPSRDSIYWAYNMDELDNYWRKRLKNEFLSLKISGKDDDKIKDVLHKRYTNLKRRLSQSQSEDVVQIYLNALSRIFDPHTSYFSPKATDDFQIRMKQSLEGIGARLSTENEYTKVVEIITGGPADKSELLKANDFIIGVGQEETGEIVDVVGWRIDDVVQLIRGPKNSKVRLQILHGEDELIADAETITITRDKVKLEDSAAKGDTIHIKQDGEEFILGVIDIPAFYLDYEAQRKGDPNFKSTTRDVEKILNDFEGQNVDGIIIDLRQNGGGFLSEAIDLTGLFIENGPVVQVRNMRGQIKVEQDHDPKLKYSGPMAVLVDQFSASASEIFAAAIQDYGRGIIVGNQTFGKGTVQNMLDLNQYIPGSTHKYGQVKLTIAKFYRINGGSTQHVGVIPDIELPSRFNHDEIGESSQKNALLWDQISAVDFLKDQQKISTFLPSLKLNHNSRFSTEESFASFNEKIEKMKEKKQKRRYSLNEETRRAEREKAKNKKENRKENEEDLLLVESGNILADYIMLIEK
ncbi:MAG: tail-specific protease [Calditrichaeota bacterium]|nr:MAG: tail-specific protease [Calditrichota bacterium]MBL1206280.1 tail-specific protease [Calditrichota bacterium]NOG46106.1 carboxy terminal-processing peptidase [Calditrichota bacterium]